MTNTTLEFISRIEAHTGVSYFRNQCNESFRLIRPYTPHKLFIFISKLIGTEIWIYSVVFDDYEFNLLKLILFFKVME